MAGQVSKYDMLPDVFAGAADVTYTLGAFIIKNIIPIAIITTWLTGYCRCRVAHDQAAV